MKLCVFVHGFSDNYLLAWGRLSYLLEAERQNDPVLSQWDFLFLGYDTIGLSGVISLADIIASRIEAAADGEAPFTSKYETFAFVAHSMGTLAVRYILVDPHSTRSSIRNTFKCALLFGSPILGSAWTIGAQLVPGAAVLLPVISDLNIDSSFIRQLSAFAYCSAGHHPWCDVYRYDGANDRVVHAGAASAVHFVRDQPRVTVSGGHSAIVKVTSVNDHLYQQLQARLA